MVISVMMMMMMTTSFFFSTGAIALALCHTLVTLATQIPAALAPLREEVFSLFRKVIVSADDDSQESKDLVVCFNLTALTSNGIFT